MIINKKAVFALAFLAFSLMATVFCPNQVSAETKTSNWSKEKEESWNITSLNGNEITSVVKFSPSEKKYGKDTKSIPKGYSVQGATITEKYYVFSVYKNDNAKNYIYIAERSTGKIIKTISGNWGHMNSFYYDWGSNQVRILNRKSNQKSSSKNDGCLDLNTLKMVKTSDCASARSPDYGVKGLTAQGEAQADGYVYTVGWDSGDSKNGQKFKWKRNDNIIFVYEKGSKKLLKSFYIPSSLANGEVEDIAIDGNGDVYLIYNMSQTSGGIAYYKVPASVIKSTKDKTDSDYNGDSTLAPEKALAESLKNSKKCSTSVLSEEYCDTGGASGDTNSVNGILQLIITILSGGIGIGGMAGIVWSGIIIMTSRDNAARLALGKKRLLELVVGLALYAVAAGMILWLIPG